MKLIVADDHALVREGLKTVIDELEPEAAVFEAATFRQVLDLIDLHADLRLILLDLGMPDMDRFAGLHAVRERGPMIPVVILSASEEREDVVQSLSEGAAGYIPKSANKTVMLGALRLVLSGGVYLPPLLLGRDDPAPPRPRHALLTERQIEVLRLIEEGRSNKEIANRLDLSLSTVKTHVTAILKAYNVATRAKLMLATRR